MSQHKYLMSKKSIEEEKKENEAFLRECIRIEGILLNKIKTPPLPVEKKEPIISLENITPENKVLNIPLEKVNTPAPPTNKISMSFT